MLYSSILFHIVSLSWYVVNDEAKYFSIRNIVFPYTRLSSMDSSSSLLSVDSDNVDSDDVISSLPSTTPPIAPSPTTTQSSSSLIIDDSRVRHRRITMTGPAGFAPPPKLINQISNTSSSTISTSFPIISSPSSTSAGGGDHSPRRPNFSSSSTSSSSNMSNHHSTSGSPAALRAALSPLADSKVVEFVSIFDHETEPFLHTGSGAGPNLFPSGVDFIDSGVGLHGKCTYRYPDANMCKKDRDLPGNTIKVLVTITFTIPLLSLSIFFKNLFLVLMCFIFLMFC